jgi:DeoR/GlpR family transcriptional regulator of sugar metabolism
MTRQQELISEIRNFVREKGYAPTIRELVARLDISHGTVQRELMALASDGKIAKSDRTARSIRVLD